MLPTMPAQPFTRRRPVALAACCAVAACCAAAGAPAPATAASTSYASVSENWAGYVATHAGGAGFSSVSGTWRAPSATCTAGRETESAVWVGLGGYSETSRGLEQIGTDANCSRAGKATYGSWFELLPAEPVNLRLAVHPGDTIVASVTRRGDGVTLRIRNLTTGARLSATRRTGNIDVSSAEWIVEAPSVCVSGQRCAVLALTDFGEVDFSSATAVAHGHTGAVGDARWSASALELQQRSVADAGGGVGGRVLPTPTLVVAVPSVGTGLQGEFSVAYRQRPLQGEGPQPSRLPGFGGGPPQ